MPEAKYEKPAELLDRVRAELAPAEDANPFVPLVEQRGVPLAVIGELAAQQRRIIASDRRSFLTLAARSADTPAGAWYAELANGESRALDLLPALAQACGHLGPTVPISGCQAYPAHVAWLALNGDPASTALALTANFSAWGDYCRRIGESLRTRYGLSDHACAFFDFFATPAPEDPALAAITGADPALALEYGRLLQDYEILFWTTLTKLT